MPCSSARECRGQTHLPRDRSCNGERSSPSLALAALSSSSAGTRLGRAMSPSISARPGRTSAFSAASGQRRPDCELPRKGLLGYRWPTQQPAASAPPPAEAATAPPNSLMDGKRHIGFRGGATPEAMAAKTEHEAADCKVQLTAAATPPVPKGRATKFRSFVALERSRHKYALYRLHGASVGTERFETASHRAKSLPRNCPSQWM